MGGNAVSTCENVSMLANKRMLGRLHLAKHTMSKTNPSRTASGSDLGPSLAAAEIQGC